MPMTARWLLWLGSVAAVAAGATGWVATRPDYEEIPSIEFLASDAYFEIGGRRLVLPFVAGYEYLSDISLSPDAHAGKMLASAGDPNKPLRTGIVHIHIGAYRSFGEQLAAVGICSLLKREWSRQLCHNHRPGLLAALP